MSVIFDKTSILEDAKSVLYMEIAGAQSLETILDANFVNICEILASTTGKVCITGVGKSGNIGTKIVSSLSSLGIPSFFLDANNASHGDVGSLQVGDILIAISNSGEAKELVPIVEFCKKYSIKIIAITRKSDSTLCVNADFTITLPQLPEASEFGAPTTSTTQTLIVGDILAVCVSKIKGFTVMDYANRHPSGALGLANTQALKFMQTPVPMVDLSTSFLNGLRAMNDNAHGFVCIVDGTQLCGIVTDGDVRRAIISNLKMENISDIMVKSPKYINSHNMLSDAIRILQECRIDVLPVVDGDMNPIGYLSRKDFAIWL